MTSTSVPVLLDTDIGTNVDDALCLAYLLRQARCELLGVTTVGRKSGRRAELVRAVLAAFGRGDIPVHAGYAKPLGPAVMRTEPWLAEVLPEQVDPPVADPDAAADFMARTIAARPGAITLITIGPLTNAVRLFERHPEAARQLRGVVSMCGAYGEVGGLDPEAAARLFEAEAPGHHVLGADITARVALPAGELRARLDGHVPQIIIDLHDAWAREKAEVRVHDPMTAAFLFVPELYVFERARCTVITGPVDRLGETRADRFADPAPHALLTGVNGDALLEHLVAQITEASR